MKELLKTMPFKKHLIKLILLMNVFMLPLFMLAQTQGVRGTVTDASGEAIIGANVTEKGSVTNGTSTDGDGKFTIKVSRGATLLISYIGYIPQEVTVKSENESLNTLYLQKIPGRWKKL